jgi:hypothetical protein
MLLLASSLATAACAARPPVDLHAYAGQYALVDGRILTISDDAGKLVAQLSKRHPTMHNARFSDARPIELTPDGLGRFTSSRPLLHITFAPDGTGDIAQVLLSEQGAAARGLAQR